MNFVFLWISWIVYFFFVICEFYETSEFREFGNFSWFENFMNFVFFRLPIFDFSDIFVNFAFVIHTIFHSLSILWFFFFHLKSISFQSRRHFGIPTNSPQIRNLPNQINSWNRQRSRKQIRIPWKSNYSNSHWKTKPSSVFTICHFKMYSLHILSRLV